jgi:hypothetical protein
MNRFDDDEAIRRCKENENENENDTGHHPTDMAVVRRPRTTENLHHGDGIEFLYRTHRYKLIVPTNIFSNFQAFTHHSARLATQASILSILYNGSVSHEHDSLF